MCGIYKITNSKGKIYIGQTINFEKRFKYYEKLSCKSQPKLYNSLKKYGYENHKIEILEICNKKDLNKLERYYQDLYDVLNNGLNCILTNTEELSLERSNEVKAKMASYGFKNKKHTEETKALMRKNNKRAMLGRIDSDETRLKRSLAKIGKCVHAKECLYLETGIFYNNLKELCQTYNLSYNKIHGQLRRLKCKTVVYI